MTKREKVFQALEICSCSAIEGNSTCSVCPYRDAKDYTVSCREMMRDVLELLKENEGYLLYHVGEDASADELALEMVHELFDTIKWKHGEYEYRFRYMGGERYTCYEVRKMPE